MAKNKSTAITKVRNSLAVTDPIGIGKLRDRNPKDLRTYIAKVQLPRIRQDIQTWRDGIKEAELAYFGQRIKMQQLYYDTVNNGHVAACMEKRRNLTLLRDYRIVDDAGNENEEATKSLKAQWFYDFMGYVIDAKFYGYSPIHIGDVVDGVVVKTDIIRRHNIYLGKDGDHPMVTSYPYSLYGTPIEEGEPADWHVWVGTPSDIGVTPIGYGLLYKVGMYEIILRNLLGYNADWVEIFGQPIRHAKTNKAQDDPERVALENSLDSMGSRAWIVTDPTDEIAILETRNSKGAQNPYHNLEERCEKKISKILLGHADAIDSTPGKIGSGQGQDNPIKDALDEIQMVDARFVQHIVNTLLLPKLRNIGVSIPEGLLFEFSNDSELVEARKEEDANNLILSQVIMNLKNGGLEADPKYISERSGIPVTKAAIPDNPMALPGMSKDIKNRMERIYAH